MTRPDPMMASRLAAQAGDAFDDGSTLTFAEVLGALRRSLRWIILAPLAAGALMAVYTGFIAPIYNSSTTFMPPQQAQSGLASALASLGPLAAIAGAATNPVSSVERYVALMQSDSLSDRIIDQFQLMDVYKSKMRVDARLNLATNVQITIGKKDGLIKVSVDDTLAQRSADIANQYVVELRRMLSSIAITEAQQRRVFFEQKLKESRDSLIAAQQDLQSSGFSAGALKVEPRAAAETYAKLRAEVTTAEVKLQALRQSRAEQSAEVISKQSELTALRTQLARYEQSEVPAGGPDFVSKFREFKYQETLFELYARQFELARVDESREGTLIQVVDPARPAERKSKPKRAVMTLVAAMAALLSVIAFVLVRHAFIRPEPGQPQNAAGEQPIA